MAKDVIDEFLTDSQAPKNDSSTSFIKDDRDPFQGVEVPLSEVTGNESDGEPVQEANTTEDGERIPFNQDPKIQRYIDKKVREAIASQTPATPAQRQIIDQAVKEVGNSDSIKEAMEALTEIVGNDTQAKRNVLSKFEKALNDIPLRGRDLAMERLTQLEQAQLQETEKNIAYLTSEFDAIEEESGVEMSTKERDAFVDFIGELAPKDANGDITQYPDIRTAYRYFKASQRPSNPNARAKQLASRSMSRSTEATAPAPKGNSWKDVERILGKMS